MMYSRTPRTMPVPLPAAGRLGVVLVLLLSPWLAACEDAPTDPLTGLVAEESHAALALGVDLPSPVSMAGSLEGIDQEVATWRASWEVETELGMAARDPLYLPLARALAGELQEEDLGPLTSRLDDGLVWARGLPLQGLPDHIAAQITTALALGAAARAALESGDRIRAIERLLRGADALRMTGPPAVAGALVAKAENLLGRVSEDDPYTDQDLERVRRLVRGGRYALEKGDWARAIRRAYYATGILEGND
jgi:hypothetical protein